MKKYIIFLISLFFIIACSKETPVSTSNTAPGATGTGGSLARFTIVNDYLYTVDGTSLNVFSISNTNNIVFKNKVSIGMNIETIFPYNGKLFIASSNGMYIYGLSNPTNPNQETFVQHFTGCDPVVVSGYFAYLTIHGGTRCNSSINQLQVYNISNMAYPQLIKTINLTNPFGLGIKDTVLYVCDNGVGMRSYNIKNPYNIVPIQIETGENFVDVIPLDSIMVCMLTNGVAFYDIKNPGQISKLSVLR